MTAVQHDAESFLCTQSTCPTCGCCEYHWRYDDCGCTDDTCGCVINARDDD